MFRFLLPGEEERRDWVRIVMAAFVGIGMRSDGVSTTDGVRGVIGVIPPGKSSLPPGGLLAFLFRTKARPRLRLPTVHFARRGLALLAEMERLHIREPHYYVQMIGVHPAHQGTGLGRVLLEPVTRIADSKGVSVYLETTKESNLRLYQHFGFEVLKEVSLPGGFPPLWAMRRPARRVPER
jgi:ribosomal protein S18 acetylase RimI-like enzyme